MVMSVDIILFGQRMSGGRGDDGGGGNGGSTEKTVNTEVVR